MSRSTFRVLFYLKRNAPKKNGLVPVMCRITVNGKISQFSCKLDVEEKLWSVSLGRMSGRSIVAQEANRMLDKIRVGINKAYQEIMDRDGYVSAEKVRNAFLGMGQNHKTLLAVFRQLENPGYLYYENGGSFIPGTLQKALATKGPQRHFRNECLCRAMVNFNMIDTVSRGIKKMFNEQWRRHFPMPDYEIDATNKEVGVKIYGNSINEKYTKLLKENDTLTLEDCILLDAVQKGHRISADNVVALLERGLLEGDVSEYHISLDVAKKTRQLPEYTRNKGLDKSKIQQMILQYLQNAGSTGAKRDAIFDYLKEVLPQNKTHEQQERMLGNILSEMKENGLIVPEGRTWFLKS